MSYRNVTSLVREAPGRAGARTCTKKRGRFGIPARLWTQEITWILLRRAPPASHSSCSFGSDPHSFGSDPHSCWEHFPLLWECFLLLLGVFPTLLGLFPAPFGDSSRTAPAFFTPSHDPDSAPSSAQHQSRHRSSMAEMLQTTVSESK